MAKRKDKLNFTLKIIENGKVVSKHQTHSKRRFLNHARSIKWQNHHLKMYLRVHYGKRLSNYRKIESFWNDGYYDNKEDFWIAVNAFTEDD